jgi:hypothetical protein
VRCRPLARSERHIKSDSTASVAGKPTNGKSQTWAEVDFKGLQHS